MANLQSGLGQRSPGPCWWREGIGGFPGRLARELAAGRDRPGADPTVRGSGSRQGRLSRSDPCFPLQVWCPLAMNPTGFRQGSSSDEDLVEVAEGMLDFSMADDVPPLDGESAEGNLSQPVMPLRVSSTDALRLPWLSHGTVAVRSGGESGRPLGKPLQSTLNADPVEQSPRRHGLTRLPEWERVGDVWGGVGCSRGSSYKDSRLPLGRHLSRRSPNYHLCWDLLAPGNLVIFMASWLAVELSHITPE